MSKKCCNIFHKTGEIISSVDWQKPGLGHQKTRPSGSGSVPGARKPVQIGRQCPRERTATMVGAALRMHGRGPRHDAPAGSEAQWIPLDSTRECASVIAPGQVSRPEVQQAHHLRDASAGHLPGPPSPSSIANGKRATGRDGRASQSSAPIFQIGALLWLAVVPFRAAAYLGAEVGARNSVPRCRLPKR